MMCTIEFNETFYKNILQKNTLNRIINNTLYKYEK